MGISLPYSYLSLRIHIYVLTPKTVPRWTRAQNSMSHVRIFFCIYHFSLHNEHGTYGFLHKQYKEKTCEDLYPYSYLYLSIDIYVITHKTVARWTRTQNSMSHVRIFFCIYHFSLHDEHSTYGFLHKNTKKRHGNIYTLFLSTSQHTYIFMS